MVRCSLRLAAVLSIVVLVGCGNVVGKRREDPAPRPPAATAARPRPATNLVAVAPPAPRESPLADPSTMIPPPPRMTLPDIPAAPPRDDRIAATPGKVIPASGTAPASPPSSPAAEKATDALRRLADRAAERFAKLDGFEARLTRRETVNNRAMPEEVIQYQFRRAPYSLHLKWVGLEAQGRELIYVQGKADGKVQVLTARGDGSILTPAGKRFAFLPTDANIRSKSRYDLREGGMGMSIAQFGKVLAAAERDPAQSSRLRYLGKVPRLERQSGLEGVEETIPPGAEPLMSKGGKRTTYFDPDPASLSFGLPILVMAFADTGREVEYYWFDQLKPARFGDADFDADRLWRR